MVIDHITQLRATEAGLPAAESHPDPPLASFPLRMDWEATLPVVPESHEWPVPEVAAETVAPEAYADLLPGAVKTLIKQAEAKGWTVVVTRARGAWPSVGGRPSRQRWSHAVRMHRGEARAVAVYLEGPSEGSPGAWDLLCRWDRHEPMSVHEQVTPFRASLV